MGIRLIGKACFTSFPEALNVELIFNRRGRYPGVVLEL